MPRKPKTNQPKTPNKIQKRDFFQTPAYAVELLILFIPDGTLGIWEPACGIMKISDVLKKHGYAVWSTDLLSGKNFLTDEMEHKQFIQAIITNPPFSIKQKFFEKCIEYNLPFALLLPFDMNLWLCEAFDKYNCQALVPNRRIDYITPNNAQKSSAQFHSMWLTRYFDLPKQLTVVELTNKMKGNI
jgi:hypothetical protein